ncbi:MAG: hypothetical protein ABGX00_00875 [Allomuricauda sp.]|jgi:hypothetical protein
MTKKQEKEYEDEIRALNSILLEMKDHANALAMSETDGESWPLS